MGISNETLLALTEDGASPLFDEREQAALAYAEAMTVSGREVDDRLFARIRAHFSEEANRGAD